MEKNMSEWKNIGSLLLEHGFIDDDGLKEGISLQREKGMRLGEALVELGKVSIDDINWVLSKQLDVPYVIVEDIHVNIDLLHKFQKDFLMDSRILPLYETEDEISIVTDDPLNKSAMEFIATSFEKKVNISTGSGRKIEDILKRSFKQVGLPELVGALSGIIDKIKDTSFYRLDFLLDERSCRINAFGVGVMKNMQEIKSHFTNEDVFRAFDELSIPFLYEQSFGSNSRFLAVFPVFNRGTMVKYPAIIGGFGLFCPETTTFADSHVNGISDVFPYQGPVPGYPYLATKGNQYDYESMIFTVDTVPAEFHDFYVNTWIPQKCPSCSGAGCPACRELGYEFEKIEGVYSSGDLKEKLKEGCHGKN